MLQIVLRPGTTYLHAVLSAKLTDVPLTYTVRRFQPWPHISPERYPNLPPSPLSPHTITIKGTSVSLATQTIKRTSASLVIEDSVFLSPHLDSFFSPPGLVSASFSTYFLLILFHFLSSLLPYLSAITSLLTQHQYGYLLLQYLLISSSPRAFLLYYLLTSDPLIAVSPLSPPYPWDAGIGIPCSNILSSPPSSPRAAPLILPLTSIALIFATAAAGDCKTTQLPSSLAQGLVARTAQRYFISLPPMTTASVRVRAETLTDIRHAAN